MAIGVQPGMETTSIPTVVVPPAPSVVQQSKSTFDKILGSITDLGKGFLGYKTAQANANQNYYGAPQQGMSGPTVALIAVAVVGGIYLLKRR